jgi:hypothetical protein
MVQQPFLTLFPPFSSFAADDVLDAAERSGRIIAELGGIGEEGGAGLPGAASSEEAREVAERRVKLDKLRKEGRRLLSTLK